MGRMRDGLKNIGNKLKSTPKGKQSRAFVRIVQFFVLMLILTIFARGAAGVTMPVVTVTGLSQQSISTASEFNGVISSASKEDVKMPVGLKVTQVLVSAGNTVKAGDELVTFDVQTVQDSLMEQKIALQDLEVKLAELQKPADDDNDPLKSAEKAVESAQKALNDGRATADQSVAAAQDALNKADGELGAAQGAYDTAVANLNSLNKPENYPNDLPEIIPPEPEPPVKPEDPDDTAAWEKYGLDLQEYNTKHEAWLKEMELYNQAAKPHNDYAAAEQAVATAQQEVAAQETARGMAASMLDETALSASKQIESLQEVLDDANENLADIKKQIAEGKPLAQLQEEKRKLEIQKTKQSITEQEEALTKLELLAASNGTVTATIDGMVTQVSVVKDAVTTETDYVRLATSAGGYVVEFNVTQENARQIKVGSMVSVKLPNYYGGTEARVVGRSMAGEGGAITMRAQMMSGEWTDGDSVSVNVVFSDKTYWTCVPLSAVRPDTEGQYVLMLYEENTILGQQTVARKVPVEIQDKDENYAALSEIYESNPRIVVSSSKPVNDGDMVRLSEESTK